MGGLQLLASLGLIVIAPLIDDRVVTAVGVAAQVGGVIAWSPMALGSPPMIMARSCDDI